MKNEITIEELKAAEKEEIKKIREKYRKELRKKENEDKERYAAVGEAIAKKVGCSSTDLMKVYKERIEALLEG